MTHGNTRADWIAKCPHVLFVDCQNNVSIYSNVEADESNEDTSVEPICGNSYLQWTQFCEEVRTRCFQNYRPCRAPRDTSSIPSNDLLLRMVKQLDISCPVKKHKVDAVMPGDSMIPRSIADELLIGFSELLNSYSQLQ